MKKIAVVILFILFNLSSTFLNAQTCTECLLTDEISISTGRGHFQVGAVVFDVPILFGRDSFWSVRSGPNNARPYPKCAFGQGGSNAISVNMNGSAPATHSPFICRIPSARVASDYVLEREFRVCRNDANCDIDLTIGALQFAHHGSETGISSIELIAPSPLLNNSLFTGCENPNTVNAFPNPITNGTTFFNVPIGLYRIKIKLRNNNSGFNQSGFSFSLLGNVSTNSNTCGAGTEGLVENAHFGKRVFPTPGFCAPPYGPCSYLYEADLLGNRCIPANTSGTFTIDPYCPDSNYEFDDGINLPITASSASVSLLTGNYTMTVTDARGCSYTQLIDIGEPTLSVTAVTPCVPPPNGASILLLNFTNYSPFTDMRINGGPWVLPYSPYVHIGNYTVEIRDANGCIASANVSVGNDFTASLSASTCFQGTGTLTASTQPTASSLVGLIKYQFFDFNMNPLSLSSTSNTYTISNGGTYYVVITDSFGCSATATVTAYAQPNITFNVPPGPCPKTITANVTPPGNNYMYSWNNGIPTTNNSFIATTPSVYNLVVSNGPCSATSNIAVTCTPCLDPLIPNAATIFPDGSSVTQLYWPGGASISLPGNIIIEGDFYIDAPFQFSSCPNVLLGPDANIIVYPGQSLYIDNSHFRAGCNEMWTGITATGPDALIDIKTSTLQDMEEGVRSETGASLNVRDNTFTRNYIGMQVIDADPGFDIQSGRCIIMRNHFTTDGFLLLPMITNGLGPANGEHGIKLIRCEQVNIGADPNNFSAWDGNRFTDIYNGILIQPDEFTGQVDNYNLRANTFDQIFVSSMTELDKFNNAYNLHRGAAIFCPISQHMSNNGHHVYIKGSDDDAWDFIYCDKAVVLNGINATIERTKVSHTLLGYLMGTTDDHRYSIYYNWGEAIFHGIQLIGNTAVASVYDNYLWTRNQPVTITATSHHWPKGIEVRAVPNNNPISILRNRIDHQSVGGEGIDLKKVGPRVSVGHNTIDFKTTQIASVVGQNAHLYGIRVRKSEGSTIEENNINGQSNYQALFAANPPNRASTCIGLAASPEFNIRCNYMDNTDDGFRIEGNCSTQPTVIEYNQFNDHKIPMHFLEFAGDDGTLGDIGTSWFNNNNTFSLGDDPINWPSPHNMLGPGSMPVKLYRVTSCTNPVSENYYSDFNNTSHVLLGESWSSVSTSQCMYNPVLCKADYEPLCSYFDQSEASEKRADIEFRQNTSVANQKNADLVQKNEPMLFPNPTSGEINLNYTSNQDADLSFYDMSGREVATVKLNKEHRRIQYDLPLTSGIYIWKCVSNGQIIDRGKLVVE